MTDHETGAGTTSDGGRTPVLAMEGITKAFGDNVANDKIDLDLHRGEVHGLLGENGAGKSTLMKILYGLYTADSGRILLGGTPASIKNPGDAVSAGIGMVHQHYTLVPTLTVAENVVLGAEPRRAGVLMDRDAAAKAVSKLSEQYGLKVDPNARVGNLSVGLQQRVEILKALHRDARILILDEPTAVLTPQEADDLFGVLRGFVDEGLSIILITHKLGELLGVSDRITVIRDGRVVDTVNTSETNEAQLATLMVGRPVVLRVDRTPATPADVRLAARGLEVMGPTGQPAVRGIDLEVRGGEILAVAGVDGNGQVELAEALAGMRPVAAGAVHVDGQDVTGLGAGTRADRGLAYIPEDRGGKGLVGPFTLAENCVLKRYDHAPYASRGWLRNSAISRYARERIKAFDVRPANERAMASSLSGGNQQKTIVARELDGEPAVLIANQPTRGVDVGAIEFIHRQLIAERDRGAAILLISLELDEIHQLADRIVVLYEGRVVGEVSAEDATDEQLGLWMAGRTQEASG
jgi:simple sugar transport system ATP-binding protein